MSKFYLKSTKHNGLKFKIMEFDRETKKAMLQGDTGVPFPVQLTSDNLKKYGYEVVKAEEPNHEASA